MQIDISWQIPTSGQRTWFFVFRKGEVLLRESDLSYPEQSPAQIDPALSALPLHWVGRLDGRDCLVTYVDAQWEPPAGYVLRGLRTVFDRLDAPLAAFAGRAFQIAEWARTHRFCGVCATPTRLSEREHCAICPSCGHRAYPRISPAMMVLVCRGDQILLARHAAAPGRSPSQRHTALAGFVEAGESLEHTVMREVMEEVGLTVHGLQYFSSQAWPFPHSLMVAFVAEYLDGDIKIDETEILEARWYGPQDALPEVPSTMSVSGRLIRHVLAQRQPGRPALD